MTPVIYSSDKAEILPMKLTLLQKIPHWLGKRKLVWQTGQLNQQRRAGGQVGATVAVKSNRARGG